jgi:hypothetical protein
MDGLSKTNQHQETKDPRMAGTDGKCEVPKGPYDELPVGSLRYLNVPSSDAEHEITIKTDASAVSRENDISAGTDQPSRIQVGPKSKQVLCSTPVRLAASGWRRARRFLFLYAGRKKRTLCYEKILSAPAGYHFRCAKRDYKISSLSDSNAMLSNAEPASFAPAPPIINTLL